MQHSQRKILAGPIRGRGQVEDDIVRDGTAKRDNRSEVADGRTEGILYILLTQILLRREKGVSMKGDLGRSNAEVANI